VIERVMGLGGVPVLMYHEVADSSMVDALVRKTQRGYILVRDDFEQQIAALAATGFQSISLRELYDWSRGNATLPANPIVITFDDGFAGNYQHAFPVLARYGFGAIFFVVTNRIGDRWIMTWDQLSEMRRGGMEVGSHTANHPLLSTLTEVRTREELGGSKQAIEDKLGSAVEFLSLPNGDSNPLYEEIARENGYLGGCGSQFGFNSRTTNPFFWRRIAVKQGLRLDGFQRLLSRRPGTLFMHSSRAAAKAAVAGVLGKRTYDRLYNLVFGVDEQDKSKQP